MKSKTSNIVKFDWTSSLDQLVQGKRISPTIEKLKEAGISTILELIWLLPLRIFKTPQARPFKDALSGEYFQGSGKILHREIKPVFGRKGKGNLLLHQAYMVLQDDKSSETLALRWFNLYPAQKKQLQELSHLHFLGQLAEFKGQRQILNPQILQSSEQLTPFLQDYPTVNKISGQHLKKVMSLIPDHEWDNIPQTLPQLGYDSHLSLGEAFKTLHGKIAPQLFSNELKKRAEERLIYEEFLIDQLKILTRRKFIKAKYAPEILIDDLKIQNLMSHLPFELTPDQKKVFLEIIQDLKSGHPMMRMIQGDVGCGKTIVAYLAARVTNKAGHQVALMCPTEALAYQHLETFKNLNPALEVDLLLGSTKAKDRKLILERLKSGICEIIIGTHALFGDSVVFHKLGLAIIDEQHKFGVEQRLKLIAKGNGVHSLIMTATPIPRTLSLAQYGDLDISFIKMMPNGRKGIQTRITEKENYQKYLQFVRHRISLGEQAYFVFPAIDETPDLEIKNVKEATELYQKTFPDLKVSMLHGQMKAVEKENVINLFRDNKIHILISTSVIEVGINIPNSTIMSIYNPERFGLSSLHQLRGRVGRGSKPGFCFLIIDNKLSQEALNRLKVIETHLDGFIIAEEDLKFRGEGDLFGVDQSGTILSKKIAHFYHHSQLLEQVIRDLQVLQSERPEILVPHFERLAKDQKIIDTV